MEKVASLRQKKERADTRIEEKDKEIEKLRKMHAEFKDTLEKVSKNFSKTIFSPSFSFSLLSVFPFFVKKRYVLEIDHDARSRSQQM